MTHEIYQEVALRERQLPNKDASRYQTLKLIIQRMGADSAVVSVVMTNVGGHRLSDTRLDLVRVSTVDETGVQLGSEQMLLRAVRAVLKEAF